MHQITFEFFAWKRQNKSFSIRIVVNMNDYLGWDWYRAEFRDEKKIIHSVQFRHGYTMFDKGMDSFNRVLNGHSIAYLEFIRFLHEKPNLHALKVISIV